MGFSIHRVIGRKLFHLGVVFVFQSAEEVVGPADGPIGIVVSPSEVGVVGGPRLLAPLHVPACGLGVQCGMAAEEELRFVVPSVGVGVVGKQAVVDAVEAAQGIILRFEHLVGREYVVVFHRKELVVVAGCEAQCGYSCCGYKE